MHYRNSRCDPRGPFPHWPRTGASELCEIILITWPRIILNRCKKNKPPTFYRFGEIYLQTTPHTHTHTYFDFISIDRYI